MVAGLSAPIAFPLWAFTASAATTAAYAAPAAVGAAVSAFGGACATAFVGFGVATGPIGWAALAVGASQDSSTKQAKFDCWRQILHENEVNGDDDEGITLADLAMDQRVRKIELKAREDGNAYWSVQNVWKENFELNFVSLRDGQIALHAIPAVHV